MNYYINPNLLISPLQGDLFCLINLCLPNAIKIINKRQYDLFELIKKMDVEDIFEKYETEKASVLIFLKILEKKQFISASGIFDFPTLDNDVKFLDFWIHVTDACNLSCQYCSITTKHTHSKLQISQIPDIISTIIFLVKTLGVQKLSLRFAGGEPMLNFEVIEIILNSIKAELPSTCQLGCAVLTNLTVLSPRIIEYLSVNQIFVGVSLDGIGKYHDITRVTKSGNSTFNVVIANIRALKEKNVSVNVTCVISNRNMEGIPTLIDFFIQNNISHRLSIVRGEEVDYSRVAVILRQVYKTMEKYVSSGYKFSQLHRLCDLKLTRPTVFTCGAKRNSFVIYTNGDLYACPHLIGCESEILGNIGSKNNLLSIIKERPFIDKMISDACLKCKYRYICTGGCPIFRDKGKSPACKFYQEMIPLVYHLLGMERLYQVKKNMMTF